jgi:cytochrome c2
MKDANVTWDDANLDKYLANPTGFIHGTRMLINLPATPIGRMSSPTSTR